MQIVKLELVGRKKLSTQGRRQIMLYYKEQFVHLELWYNKLCFSAILLLQGRYLFVYLNIYALVINVTMHNTLQVVQSTSPCGLMG